MTIPQNYALPAALDYADKGWMVLPLKPEEKKPANRNGLNGATRDPPLLQSWFEGTQNNLGIRTGAVSGLVVLDVDYKSGGEASLEALQALLGDLPETLRVDTGNGHHRYFAIPAGCPKIGNRAGMAGFPGLDVRGDGGYVVAPPSKHPNGRQYSWSTPAGADGVLAQLPIALLELMILQSKVASTGQNNGPITEGQRNDTLFKRACGYRSQGLDNDQISVLLSKDNDALCTPPLPPAEVMTIVSSALRYDPQSALTDLENSRRLVKRADGNYRYAYDASCWLRWTGERWAKDADGAALRLAMEVADALLDEGRSHADPKERAKAIKAARSAQRVTALRAMVELARCDETIGVRFSDFDQDLHLLNVKNGTIDLRNGAISPHDRERKISKLINIDFDPAARCPTFDSFIRSVFCGDAELADCVQQTLGYGATGETKEQAVFICNGPGANGKSTLLNTVSHILGDYAFHTPTETLVSHKHGKSGSSDIARLAGARFVTASEGNAEDKLAVGLIKQLSGGDTVTARFLYGTYFQFEPRFKIFFGTNHLPRLDATDDAIWRRLRILPFDKVFSPAEQDRDLPEKLKSEAAGILAWIVAGAQLWYSSGRLPVPTRMGEALSAYRADMDSVGLFLSEWCTEDGGAETPAGQLFREYREWGKPLGVEPVSQTLFGLTLTRKGFPTVRRNGGVTYRKGLKLKALTAPPLQHAA